MKTESPIISLCANQYLLSLISCFNFCNLVGKTDQKPCGGNIHLRTCCVTSSYCVYFVVAGAFVADRRFAGKSDQNPQISS